ncbi:hypothetical protein AB0K14_03330 [Actinosynnema sp. NPDC050801]|uniref:hypothetical protein n=1 Tax=unclassified Actinosynnema TaxID=2637065 RepID=UPI0033FB0664
MTTALVPTGRVLVCCGEHLPGGCCDAEDCAPCCPECPACPVVQARTPDQRAADAAAHRELLLALTEWANDIRSHPIRREAPPCPISSP